jgi:hypothetical protein
MLSLPSLSEQFDTDAVGGQAHIADGADRDDSGG